MGAQGQRHRRARQWIFVIALEAALALAGVAVVGGVGGLSQVSDSSLQTALTRTGESHHTTRPARATGASDHWLAVEGEPTVDTGVVRTHHIGADEVVWDYAPSGMDGATGRKFSADAKTFVRHGPDRIGSRYLKCVYRGYTDATFSQLVERPAAEAHLGLLGPVIRAAVGDTIRVVFRNGCRFPATLHPHGVFYDKRNEGSGYADGTTARDARDDAVPSDGRHTYVWRVPGRAGPGPHDGSSVMWMYHSHTDEVVDTNTGLMGPMVITSAGSARPDATPTDVDHEVFELFSVMDENVSHYLSVNRRRFTSSRPDRDDEGFIESNLMHAVNGYVFGNQPMVTVRQGQRVRWYLMAMGTEIDLHTPHWHGNTVMVSGMRMDTVSLLPAGMAVADMVPDDPGVWLFHCHVNDHIVAGMTTRYRVLPPSPNGRTEHRDIVAELHEDLPAGRRGDRPDRSGKHQSRPDLAAGGQIPQS